MTKLLTILFFFFAMLSVQAATWVVNPAHSQVLFEVPFLKWSEVTGRFEKLTGTIIINDKNQEPEALSLKIQTSSIDTGNEMRDGHLKGNDFFQSKAYPSITFQSTKIAKLSGGVYEVTGELTIKNRSLPHRLKFSLSQTIKDTWAFENRFVKFTTDVDRRHFGLHWNKTLEGEEFLIGDLIRVKGSIQIQPSSSVTPNSKHMIPDTAYIRTREKILRGEITQEALNPLPEISQQLPSVSPKASDKKLPQVQTKAPHSHSPGSDRKTHQTPLWWTSYMLLGMFGFFGVAIVGITFKKVALKAWANRYEETGAIGTASDFFVIGMVFIYSLAFWFVAWG